MSNTINYTHESKFEKLISMISSSIKELRENYELTITSYYNALEEQSDLEDEMSKISESLNFRISESESIKLELKEKQIEFSKKSDELHKKVEDLSCKAENLQSRYELLCSAISPMKATSDRYKQFKKIINGQLLPLINRVNALSNEAEQVIKIKAIDDEMRLTESLKAFSERSIVAVAGGFSSGKSSFISSLFEDEGVLLPIGIEPVTAIPTYVFHAEELTITGYPKAGGQFEIPQQIYAKLSHQFVEDFGFNLRDLLPFASLEVPMKSFKNLAFIDLPGYNPGDRDGTTSEDRSTSEEYINQAQALLWMIGLDSNGTIPRDDLDHLWELAENNVPLYVVLNKADLRPMEALDEVLDQVADELLMNGIQYLGLCAYSSEGGGELSFRERSIWNVLDEWDQPREALSSVVKKIKEVFTEYENALINDIKQRKNKTALIKSLELNLLEIGAFDTDYQEPFEVSKYMEDGIESNVKNKKTYGSSGFIVSWMKMQEDKDGKNPIRKSQNKKAKVKEEKKDYKAIVEKRNDTIIEVREQIQSLREDYRIDKVQKDLDDLYWIHQSIMELLVSSHSWNPSSINVEIKLR